MRKIFSWGAFAISLIFLASAFSAEAATLTVSPSSGSVPVGNVLTVNIQLNTQGDAAHGVDVFYLNFNPALLQVIDENASVSGIQIAPGTLMSVTPSNTVDQAAGRIAFHQVTAGGTTFTNSTSQTLATVRFNVLAAGTAALTFNFTPGNTSDSNVATVVGGTATDLLTSVTNGSYTLTAVSSFDFALSNSGARSVTQGSSVTNSISATLSSGTTQSVSYSAAGLPSGVTASFSPTSCNPTCSTTMTLNASASATLGAQTVTVTGTAGALARTTTFALTVNAPVDGTAPIISAISATSISQTGATIVWTTNESSDTQVEYGQTTSYGASTVLNTSLVTAHTATIAGLSPGTMYNYRVKSRDAATNLGISLNNTFMTAPAPDTTPPNLITGLAASNVQQNAFTLSWSAPSDLPGGGSVSAYDLRYSTSLITQANFNSATQATGEPAPGAPGSSQNYVLAGLSPGVTYSAAIVSRDAAGNVSLISNAVSVTTQAPSDTVAPTISITAPLSNATVAGASVSILATAADNVGVVGVQFRVDSTNVGIEDALFPYSTTWNSTTVADGLHSLTAVARDAAGNTTTSNVVSVNVLNTVPVVLDFSITNEGNKSVTQGSSITNTINATLTSGAAQSVSFTASGLPAGATATFSPGLCLPNCSTVMTIDTISAAIPRTQTVTVTATDGSITRTTSFSLAITASPSTKFATTDPVQVRAAAVEVRSSASASAALLGSQTQGVRGVITGGPTFADGSHWWQVNYDSGADGWSIEDSLEYSMYVTNLQFAPRLEGTSNILGKTFTISLTNPLNGEVVATFAAAANTVGRILLPPTIATLTPGTYDLFATASRFLKRKLVSSVVASNSTLTLPELVAGNLNSDSIINALDWSIMNTNWATNSAAADIDENGLVNALDFSWLNKNWNRVED